jgi:hypothetical protein
MFGRNRNVPPPPPPPASGIVPGVSPGDIAPVEDNSILLTEKGRGGNSSWQASFERSIRVLRDFLLIASLGVFTNSIGLGGTSSVNTSKEIILFSYLDTLWICCILGFY